MPCPNPCTRQPSPGKTATKVPFNAPPDAGVAKHKAAYGEKEVAPGAQDLAESETAINDFELRKFWNQHYAGNSTLRRAEQRICWPFI